MKKRILILLGIILSIMMVGCSNLNNKEEQQAVISKGETNNNFVMGVDYQISNLMQGKYNVALYAKEYKHGELEKEHTLFEYEVEVNEEGTLPIGVYEEEEELFSGINGTYQSNSLEFFKDSYDTGMAMSILDEETELKFNGEMPIVSYSIGDKITNSINLSEDLQLGTNKKDLIIYLKVNKI